MGRALRGGVPVWIASSPVSQERDPLAVIHFEGFFVTLPAVRLKSSPAMTLRIMK